MRICSVFLFLFLVLPLFCNAVPLRFQIHRNKFVQEERMRRLGANLVLNFNEEKVNRYLMTLKKTAIIQSRLFYKPYPAAVHFFKSKVEIDKSEIFHIIQMMPKGGALHLHAITPASVNWMIKNLTYVPDLYTRYNESSSEREYFYSATRPRKDWLNVEEERKLSEDPGAFDRKLANDLTIWVKDPGSAYSTIDDVWIKFLNVFRQSKQLMATRQDRLNAIERAMKESAEDNVQYQEMRTSLMIDDYGNSDMDGFFEEMATRVSVFQEKNPTFMGMKFILQASRCSTKERMMMEVQDALRLYQKYPHFVIGFDIAFQEDRCYPTSYYLDALLNTRTDKGLTLPFYFHAGETDWTYGNTSNLVDAVLLNATRIGHGFAILKHPRVMEAVSRSKIAIEINPISNQVLGLVSDLRNHPGAILFANGAASVVSSDNHSTWYASPLSHDFYMAFMGLASIDDDLRLLKQLAINSFRYSGMEKDEKSKALVKWEAMWDVFIQDVVSKYGLE